MKQNEILLSMLLSRPNVCFAQDLDGLEPVFGCGSCSFSTSNGFPQTRWVSLPKWLGRCPDPQGAVEAACRGKRGGLFRVVSVHFVEGL